MTERERLPRLRLPPGSYAVDGLTPLNMRVLELHVEGNQLWARIGEIETQSDLERNNLGTSGRREA
jgi:hypothetical protein